MKNIKSPSHSWYWYRDRYNIAQCLNCGILMKEIENGPLSSISLYHRPRESKWYANDWPCVRDTLREEL